MTEQPPLFPMDYGMFRYLLHSDVKRVAPYEWTDRDFEILKNLDVAAELETWFMIMANVSRHFVKGKGSAKDVHPAGIIESVECQILIHALLDIIAASSDEPVASEAKKNPLVRLAKKDPKIAIALAFTVGQLSVAALNRPQEKQYARGKTRYDNLKAANAAKGKPSPDDEFLILYQKAQSLFDTPGDQVKWLRQQLNLSRSQVYKRIKALK
jgi:hypothetical protein